MKPCLTALKGCATRECTEPQARRLKPEAWPPMGEVEWAGQSAVGLTTVSDAVDHNFPPAIIHAIENAEISNPDTVSALGL